MTDADYIELFKSRSTVTASGCWEEALAQPGPIPQSAPTKRRWNHSNLLSR